MIRQSFKRQLFAVFLVVTLILVIGGGILTVQGFQARIRSDYMQNDLQQENVVRGRILDMLQQVDTAMSGLANNQILMQALEGETPYDLQAVYSALYQETQDIRNFCAVDIYSGGDRIYTTSSVATVQALPLGYMTSWAAAGSAGEMIYSLDPGEDMENGASLLIARQLLGGETPAFVVVRIGHDNIAELLTGALNVREGFILTNQFLRPFCMLGTAADGNDLALVRRNLMNSVSYSTGAANNIYISELGETGLLSIYITPPALESSVAMAGYQIILILTLVSIMLCLLVVSQLSTWFSKPINKLAAAMRRLRSGDLDTRIEMKREDEFGQLATGFNKMAERLTEYMQEQVNSERRLNETRIAMMQAQLNPHFLYNTLDTIKWVAKANQVPEIATLSANLAGILRTGISSERFCRLEEELALVEKYCEIQRFRFNDCFDLEINVADRFKKILVPKLILQPIVENAVLHGLDGRQEGHICIAAAEETEGAVTITVSDNGSGIGDEMIRALREEDEKVLSGHLGLGNVNTILRLYYGAEYGIKAERLLEGGTRIHVRLPLNWEQPAVKTKAEGLE